MEIQCHKSLKKNHTTGKKLTLIKILILIIRNTTINNFKKISQLRQMFKTLEDNVIKNQKLDKLKIKTAINGVYYKRTIRLQWFEMFKFIKSKYASKIIIVFTNLNLYL